MKYKYRRDISIRLCGICFTAIYCDLLNPGSPPILYLYFPAYSP